MIKKKTTKKRKPKVKKVTELDLLFPIPVEVKRTGQELTEADRVKGTAMSASLRDMLKKIKTIMSDGRLSNLQAVTLENWARMLTSENDSERAFATEKITRYLFAPKKEVVSVPIININCTFVGIKDAK